MSTEFPGALEEKESAGRAPGADDSGRARKAGGVAGIAVFLAFVLALGAAGLAGKMWWDARGAGETLQTRLDRMESTLARHGRELSELDARLHAISNADAGAGLEALQSELDEQVLRGEALATELEVQKSFSRTLQSALEAMQARLMAAETSLAARAPSPRGATENLDLAEVDYLLRLASERLQLFRDPRSADRALALADAQLQALDNPMHLGVRQHIADARRALASVELPEVVALSAEIDTLQGRLAALTFATEVERQQAAAETTSQDQGWWARLKRSMSRLVTVRRSADAASARLTLEDRDLLRQGLWMQLEGARLGLMRHDQAAWDDALARARSLLERWFDESSPEYRAVHDALQRLSAVDVAPELPDISAPWSQLRMIRDTGTAEEDA